MLLKSQSRNPFMSVVSSAVVNLPTPSNISSMWNFGSLLGLCLMVQIVTGLFLAFHYSNTMDSAFFSVIHTCREVSSGWLFRAIHANGASFFFICVYMHIGRGIYYHSFMNFSLWVSGIAILFLLMAIAFMGYVLPWGQMSFWGATVITNLLSTIPYVGMDIVVWLWGGFSVESPTLTRFFAFHFALPFALLGLVLVHIVLLHEKGSSNPLGVQSNDKVPFHPYFSAKDAVGFVIYALGLILVVIVDPNLLGDTENFNPASPMNTPPHIQPEWYYLFAYAILRSIPNKFGGVIALVLSIAILAILPLTQAPKLRSSSFYPLSQNLFWGFISVSILLTWIGARPVESPYIVTGQLLTVLYFLYFGTNPIAQQCWDRWLLPAKVSV